MSNTNLKQKLNEINEQVDPVINELLSQDVDQLTKDVALYQCGVGGKRIRPALVVLSGQVFGLDANKLLYPAASVEILHNATLIIDDIIDHSEFRRDKPTTWSKYGKSIAECTAFTYLASVFTALTSVNNGPKIIDLYSKTLKIIIDGEVKDILFERSGREDEDFVVSHRYQNISKDDYFKMIGQKTAVLLKACCMAGAICADADKEQTETIGDFGYYLGMAFQVRDDLLDIFGDEKAFGKKIGKDIIEKKMGNYVILSAINQLEGDEKGYIEDILCGVKPVSDEDVTKITILIEKTNARKDAEEAANNFIKHAFRSLEKLPENEYRDTLRDIANYIVNRES